MKTKIIFVILLILLAAVLIFRNDISNFYSKLFQQLPRIEKTATEVLVKEVKKEIETPPPLRAKKEDPQAFLTPAGIIQWTNIHRERENLPPLSENAKLNAAAIMKLEDMFEKQYFAHISPSGIGTGDLVERSNYEFIAIGENLALGNFKNDEELVQGWMDSPGHRANILNSGYQDIGVAVDKGLFEGESTWLAVQIFGFPLSACPQPEEILKLKIENYESQLNELQKNIEILQAEIKSMRPRRGLIYNKKVAEYNRLVDQYNSLLEDYQATVAEYNAQVKLFNECALK